MKEHVRGQRQSMCWSSKRSRSKKLPLVVQDKERHALSFGGPSPLLSTYVDFHVINGTRPFPTIFAYCILSKLDSGKA